MPAFYQVSQFQFPKKTSREMILHRSSTLQSACTMVIGHCIMLLKITLCYGESLLSQNSFKWLETNILCLVIRVLFNKLPVEKLTISPRNHLALTVQYTGICLKKSQNLCICHTQRRSQITIFTKNTETSLLASKKKRKQCTTKPY